MITKLPHVRWPTMAELETSQLNCAVSSQSNFDIMQQLPLECMHQQE